MDKKSKVTINDIAARAGVSKATVSRVLNKSSAVSDDARERILAAFEETGYHPNAMARSLSLKKSNLVGMILPDLLNPVFSRIISGAESYLKHCGYSLLLTATDFDSRRKAHYIQLMRDKGVDSIIIVSDHGNADYLDAIQAFGKPVVMVGSSSSDAAIPSFQIDNERAAYDATQFLLQAGHQHIAMIAGPQTDIQSGMQRFEGYRKAMREAGNYDENLVVSAWYSFQEGFDKMRVLLERKKAFSAVFCASDSIAVGAMRQAIHHGARLPESISFMGFDDLDYAGYYVPSLSTVHQPLEQMGRQAAEAIVAMMENQAAIIRPKTVLAHAIVERESTKNRGQTWQKSI